MDVVEVDSDAWVQKRHVGDRELANALADRPCGEPLLHVFGHIHEGYGVRKDTSWPLSVNVSSCDERYRPINRSVVVDYEDGRFTLAGEKQWSF